MRNADVVVALRSQHVDFWNDFWNSVLVPKFVRWRHIMVDGLTLHSAKVFASLAVRKGDKVIDAGCGFGDTAIKAIVATFSPRCVQGLFNQGRRK
jgi:ubiquinone/menaquinone biosynthesis C-methylase UbiE